MAKKNLSITDRKIKALEDYLGIVFKDDEEYPEYVLDEYGVLPSQKESLKKLNEKVFPDTAQKRHNWIWR